ANNAMDYGCIVTGSPCVSCPPPPPTAPPPPPPPSYGCLVVSVELPPGLASVVPAITTPSTNGLGNVISNGAAGSGYGYEYICVAGSTVVAAGAQVSATAFLNGQEYT